MSIDKSASVGSTVFQIYTENMDYNQDNDFIRYSVTDDTKYIPWDYANVSRVNDRLFYLDSGTQHLFMAVI